MDEDATWYRSRPRPRPHCVRRGPSSSPAKGAEQPPPLSSAHVYCGHGRPSQLLLSSCCTAHGRVAAGIPGHVLSPKNCHSHCGIWNSIMVPLANPNPQPKRHLDRFSRFCAAHGTAFIYVAMDRAFPRLTIALSHEGI